MRRSILLLPMLASACVTGPQTSGDAICDGTRQARIEHAAALASEASDRTAVTGANLVTLIDEGCRA